MFKIYDKKLFQIIRIFKSSAAIHYSAQCCQISTRCNHIDIKKHFRYNRFVNKNCFHHYSCNKYGTFNRNNHLNPNLNFSSINSMPYNEFSLKSTCFQNFHTTNVSYSKIIQFNLADIGEGIREVSIKYWNDNIKVGNNIEEFDELCEVESDKASVTITSKYSGVIRKIHYNEGDVALVGKPLIDIEVSGDVNDTKVINKQEMFKNENMNSTQCSSQSPPIVQKPQTSYSNEPLKQMTAEQMLTVRDSPGVNTSENEPNNYVFRNNWKKILATPSVRRMIKEYNVNIKDIIGTGKHGRVLKNDVIDFIQMKKNQKRTDHEKDDVTEVNIINEKRQIDKEIIPIKGYIKGMFKSMSEANEIPSLKLTEAIDVTELKLLRQDVNEFYKNKHKITFMPFFIKALSLCISEYPILNSTIDYENNNIVIKKEHNICIAIDTPHGLVVPNIKNVQDLNVIKLSQELKRLQNDAINYKVSPTDLSSGTISISNVGNIGGLLVQPIIVPKQVCIVAFGKIQVVPVFVNDAVVPRSIIHITWAADHRVIDGATAARASNLFKQYIEKPSILLANQ